MSLPYRLRFNSFSLVKISARYASLAIQLLSLKKVARGDALSDKKQHTSFRSSNSLFSTLPLESQRTSVCKRSSVCSDPMPSQSPKQMCIQWLRLYEVYCLDSVIQNGIKLWAHLLWCQGFSVYYTVCQDSSAVCARWGLWCDPSLRLLRQCTHWYRFQLISCSEKNELTMLKISSPVVLPSSVLQKSMCSRMSLVSTYLAKATNCACPLTSTDSSNWSENDSPALSLSTSCSTISVPILSILRETVSFDSGTVLILSAAVLSTMVSASTAAAGIISSSARLNGFLVFAKSKDTAYNASSAFADAFVAFFMFSWHDVNSRNFLLKNSSEFPTWCGCLVWRCCWRWDGFIVLLANNSPHKKHSAEGGLCEVDVNPIPMYSSWNWRYFWGSVFCFCYLACSSSVGGACPLLRSHLSILSQPLLHYFARRHCSWFQIRASINN